MPDYNPDKESHRKHKWIVHKAIRGGNFDKVFADGKEMAFETVEMKIDVSCPICGDQNNSM